MLHHNNRLLVFGKQKYQLNKKGTPRDAFHFVSK